MILWLSTAKFDIFQWDNFLGRDVILRGLECRFLRILWLMTHLSPKIALGLAKLEFPRILLLVLKRSGSTLGWRAYLLCWTSLVSECFSYFWLQVHFLDIVRAVLLRIRDIRLFLGYGRWNLLSDMIVRWPFHVNLLARRCRLDAHSTSIRYQRFGRSCDRITRRS